MERDRIKKKTDLHLARKVWHMSTVLLMAFLHSQMTDRQCLIALWIIFFLSVPFDLLRLRIPAMNEFLVQRFSLIIRQREINQLAGTTYLIMGVLMLLLFFPRDIVKVSLLFLAIADPMASLIGVKYGRIRLPKGKSLEGSMTAFVLCGGIYLLTLQSISEMGYGMIAVNFALAGLIGALAEYSPFGDLDDNLTIPIFSGVGILILQTTGIS